MFFNFSSDAAKSIFSFLFFSCNRSIVSCRLSIETVGEGILSSPIYSQMMSSEDCMFRTPLPQLGTSISFSLNSGRFLITRLALTQSNRFEPPCSFIPHISQSSTSGIVGILLYAASKKPINSIRE